MNKLNNCMWCGKELRSKYFCNKECKKNFWSSDWQSKIRICKTCKNEFYPKRFNEKNCDNCKKEKLIKKYKECKECDIKFFKTRNNKDEEFCSEQCRDRYINQWKYIEKECCKCKNGFIPETKFQKTCNGCKTEEYNRTHFIQICIICGNEFLTERKLQKCCGYACNEKYKKQKAKEKYKSKKNNGEKNIKTENKNKLVKEKKLFNEDFAILNNKIIEDTILNRHLNYWLLGGFTDELKCAIKNRDGWRCYICERETNLHVHHIIPRRSGGDNSFNNLITLCSGCHKSVESGDVEKSIIQCIKRALKIK